MIFYSASLGYFLDDKVHAAMPADALRVTKSSHEKLIAAQEAGARIEPNERGYPFARFPHADERRAALIAQVKREAGRRIDTIAPVWKQINAQRDGIDPGWARIDDIRNASAFIEEQIAETMADHLGDFDVATHPLWPEIDA